MRERSRIKQQAGLLDLQGGHALVPGGVAHLGARPAAREVQALVDGAHLDCPYSNATRRNIDVSLVVE